MAGLATVVPSDVCVCVCVCGGGGGGGGGVRKPVAAVGFNVTFM